MIYQCHYLISLLVALVNEYVYVCVYVCVCIYIYTTPVFLPGKSLGQKSLVGYSPWGHRVKHN